MSETYCVRIAKDNLVFSAGHFITFGGGTCERVHGHNYRVEAEIFGPLDENHYVVDFIAARDALGEIIGELDHRMLLPTEHPQIKVVADGKELTATFEDRRWVFPECECVLLPVPNTTTELLARYVGRRLLELLEAKTGARPQHIRIAIDENYGQWGVCELRGE